MMKNISNLVVFTIFSFTVATAADEAVTARDEVKLDSALATSNEQSTKVGEDPYGLFSPSPELSDFSAYVGYIDFSESLTKSREDAQKKLSRELQKKYKDLLDSQLYKNVSVDTLSLDQFEVLVLMCLLKQKKHYSTVLLDRHSESIYESLPETMRNCLKCLSLEPKYSAVDKEIMKMAKEDLPDLEWQPLSEYQIEFLDDLHKNHTKEFREKRALLKRVSLAKEYRTLLERGFSVRFDDGLSFDNEMSYQLFALFSLFYNLSIEQLELVIKLCEIKQAALVKPECPIQVKLGAEWASIFNSLPEELQNCFKYFTVFLEPEIKLESK
jgi:hypothetical protein